MEENKYIILNNPLLYAESNAEIQNVVNTIYNQLKNISYAPGSIELLEDYGINCGDIIKCDGKTFYVMKKEINAGGVVLTCVGGQERTQENNLNKEIQALRGKSNTLKRDLESSVSTLTDITAGLSSQITQTAGSIEAQVSDLSGHVNTITQTLDGVVFQDSSTGQTVIDGSHIKSGTLTLTGQVDWNDLSQSCKSTISSMSSGYSDYDVRSYLNRTYGITQTTADGTTLAAPTILGGNIYASAIYAGKGDDCYVSMSDSGMQIYSESADKPLIKVGYYQGEWRYPYILLGYGVDETGTDKAMIKKYSDGLWLGDSDGMNDDEQGRGTGIFIDFTQNKIYKYINGTATEI